MVSSQTIHTYDCYETLSKEAAAAVWRLKMHAVLSDRISMVNTLVRPSCNRAFIPERYVGPGNENH
jgi:hypothetical protein